MPKFVGGLEETGEGRVVAAASKSRRRARRAQEVTGIPRVYKGYERMLDNEQLDAVYIATSHNYHADNAMLCLNRGLPVLVEKPFAMNAQQAAGVIEFARKSNLFCMEAMWTRFNPATARILEVLARGTIGEVRRLEAHFCVRMKRLAKKTMPWNRMYNPYLAGGALLDLGVYPISYARMIFAGNPSKITSSARMAWTGVDKSSRYLFEYENGEEAEMATSFVEGSRRDTVITGTKGKIHVPVFSRAERFTIIPEDMPAREIECGKAGFEHEIREVHRCLRDGASESCAMPLDETLDVARTMDTIRGQWGMAYPGE